MHGLLPSTVFTALLATVIATVAASSILVRIAQPATAKA
jgi:hypothetical protein